MNERWLPVVGYEGCYEVSDRGRVRSVERHVYAGRGRTRVSAARIRKPFEQQQGYLHVTLSVDGAKRTEAVHRLVAAAFIGPRPSGMDVCHNNGLKQDNRPANLRYDTRSANQLDTVRLGGHHYAKRDQCADGHEFTPENTLARENGWRRCRICTRQSKRDRRLRVAKAREVTI